MGIGRQNKWRSSRSLNTVNNKKTSKQILDINYFENIISCFGKSYLSECTIGPSKHFLLLPLKSQHSYQQCCGSMTCFGVDPGRDPWIHASD
jgi:hypothetical protein